eukprot:873205-Prymnesium_polylepis.1
MHTNAERRCSPAAPTAWAQLHALAQHARHFAPEPPWSEHRCASSGRPLASCRATTPVQCRSRLGDLSGAQATTPVALGSPHWAHSPKWWQ